MEIDQKTIETVQLEELSIDKVCRTCLCTSEDSMISLYEEEMLNKLNFFDMINQTFGKIVPSLENLPNGLCQECQEMIRKAFQFKKQCIKSNSIFSGIIEESSNLYNTDEKCTQTEQQFIQFDDEHFDNINLQEDAIFDSQPNPLMELNSTISQSIHVKSEDDDEDSNYEENDEITSQDQTEIKIEDDNQEVSEEIVESDEHNPFNGEEDVEGIRSKPVNQCEKCNKTFSRATHLKRHMLTHDDIKQLECNICNKGFNRIDHLNHHMLSNHTESKRFRCEVPDCKKGFIKQEHLKKHIEAKHTEGSKEKEICSICEKTFSSKKYLRSHMKIHNAAEKSAVKKDPQNEKPYLCSECGLRFVRNDYLVIHMRRHLGVKPYKCRFCDKGFPRATDLTVHERYHTNEKTHLCNLCGKGFQRAYNLLVHMRVHTGEKPYTCSYCSKSFSQGNDLKAHIRRHTGERFKCDLCSEGFIQGYHLTHHKRTVHGLDVKSHIRRVEKFVNPTVLPENSNRQDSILIPNETTAEQVKLEEFQV